MWPLDDNWPECGRPTTEVDCRSAPASCVDQNSTVWWCPTGDFDESGAMNLFGATAGPVPR